MGSARAPSNPAQHAPAHVPRLGGLLRCAEGPRRPPGRPVPTHGCAVPRRPAGGMTSRDGNDGPSLRGTWGLHVTGRLLSEAPGTVVTQQMACPAWRPPRAQGTRRFPRSEPPREGVGVPGAWCQCGTGRGTAQGTRDDTWVLKAGPTGGGPQQVLGASPAVGGHPPRTGTGRKQAGWGCA